MPVLIMVQVFLFYHSIYKFLVTGIMSCNITQNYSICPKEYRGKKIKVKNSLNFFACDIGGGV